MKKLLAIIVVLLMSCCLFACDKSQAPSSEGESTPIASESTPVTSEPEEGGEVTEEEWVIATGMEQFANFTLNMEGAFDDGEVIDYSVKIDGDKGEMDGESMEADEVDAVKTVFVETILAVAENFDDFTYNAEEQVFVNKANIVYDVEVLGESANITASNVKVAFNEDNRVTSISCHMVQVCDGDNIVLDITFTFSDYGTTVVA